MATGCTSLCWLLSACNVGFLSRCLVCYLAIISACLVCHEEALVYCAAMLSV